MTRPSQFLPALEGLRGLSALGVFLYHFHHVPGLEPLTRNLPILFAHGWVFVDVFFLISGWVMGHVYFNDLNTGRGLGAFLLARIIRLLPLHILVLVAWIMVAPYLGVLSVRDISLGDLFVQASLTFTWGPLFVQPLVPPSWSISAEFAVYLLFPVMVWLGLARGFKMSLVMTAAGLMGYAALELTNGSFAIIDGRSPLRALAGFAIGLGIWRFWTVCGAWISQRVGWIEAAAIGVFSVSAILGGVPILFLISAMLVIVVITDDRCWLTRFLALAQCRFLGRISYSLYLWHWFAIIFVRNQVGISSEGAAFGIAVLTVLTVLAWSHVSERFFERPVTHYLRRRFLMPIKPS